MRRKSKMLAAQAQEAAEARHAQSNAAWIGARQLLAALTAGERPHEKESWEIILRDGERCEAALAANFERYRPLGDGTYQTYTRTKVQPGFFGTQHVVNQLDVRATNQAAAIAAANAQPRWVPLRRDLPVLLTTERLIVLYDGNPLNFWWSAVKSFTPEPTGWAASYQFHTEGCEPLRLVGLAAPAIAVYSTERLHGAKGLLNHPGLAALRSAPRGEMSTQRQPLAAIEPVPQSPATQFDQYLR